MEKPKKVKRQYVDNQKFLDEIVKYKEKVAFAKANGLPKPSIPDYCGYCILKIAEKFTTKPRFSGYSFREEMVSDGIENCIQYFDNFDPKITSNPFAYFTQIIYFAARRRIKKEGSPGIAISRRWI